MIVTAIITSFNEEKYLPKLLNSLLNQSYPTRLIEVLLLNSNSTDNTLYIMERFKNTHLEKFFGIKIIQNSKGSLSSGLNLGIKNASGECILKLDSHSIINSNFIEENVKTINSGEFICGGKRPTIILNDTKLSKTLHLAEESIFGSSIANYRVSESEKYVNSIFQGMHKKEVFENCGLFDEHLLRTEDNEFYYRVRQYGYKIKYNPNILSYQYMRASLKSMLKQKFLNGYWIGLTSHINIKYFSWYHFAPFLLIFTLITCLIGCIFSPLPLAYITSGYLVSIFILSILSIINTKFVYTHLLLPFLIIFIHISYGLGTLYGLIKGLSWKKIYLREKKND